MWTTRMVKSKESYRQIVKYMKGKQRLAAERIKSLKPNVIILGSNVNLGEVK